MTPLELLNVLQAYIRRITADMLLPVSVDRRSGESKERAAEVHIMRLPDKQGETSRVPYVLLQYIKSTDTHEQGKPPESECTVRIIAATYSPDAVDGAYSILNLLTRIRVALLKCGILDRRFMLKPPLEMIVYPDETPPYYFGELMTSWVMPVVDSYPPLPGSELAPTNIDIIGTEGEVNQWKR